MNYKFFKVNPAVPDPIFGVAADSTWDTDQLLVNSYIGCYVARNLSRDGHHKTTVECNGITAESLCNPTDNFDLPKGVHMAVQRLLEKLEEDTGLHVGDIVGVVANEAGFRDNPIGLQGFVKEIIPDGAGVKLPIRKRPLYFYNRELKIIRRGNN